TVNLTEFRAADADRRPGAARNAPFGAAIGLGPPRDATADASEHHRPLGRRNQDGGGNQRGQRAAASGLCLEPFALLRAQSLRVFLERATRAGALELREVGEERRSPAVRALPLSRNRKESHRRVPPARKAFLARKGGCEHPIKRLLRLKRWGYSLMTPPQ